MVFDPVTVDHVVVRFFWASKLPVPASAIVLSWPQKVKVFVTATSPVIVAVMFPPPP
jgi:hypothetical protein